MEILWKFLFLLMDGTCSVLALPGRDISPDSWKVRSGEWGRAVLKHIKSSQGKRQHFVFLELIIKKRFWGKSDQSQGQEGDPRESNMTSSHMRISIDKTGTIIMWKLSICFDS
jgi:hypothetical protein